MIAFFTSLFVINSTLLRKTIAVLLLSQDKVANATTPPARQVDLTGIWIGQASKFTLDQRGCTAGYAGNLDTDKGDEITVTQRGNQVIIPPQNITYSGIYNGSYTQESQGTISGSHFELTTSANPSSGRFTLKNTGTLSDDGNTITGEIFCKTTAGSATAKGTFTWTRKPSCPRFQTMLHEAEDIQKLADKLERDDKAYNAAVIDIILRGYNAPYAVYMLDVPSDEIPDLFKDNEQVRAVRSQIIERIRTKARNRKKFADTGINGDFIPDAPVYSKENIELFCTLDPSKFTKDFWDSLWMAGYIDYDLYTQVEKKLIIYGHKEYFETLVDAETLLIPIERPFLYIARYSSGVLKGLSLTKLQVKFIDLLKSRKPLTTAKLGSVSSAEAATANSLTALTRTALPAGEAFATSEGIRAAAKETGTVSAEEANAAIINQFPGVKPPFLEGTKVTRYKVGEKGLNLVRFWGGKPETGSIEAGAYSTLESEAIAAKGDVAALRDALALPPGNTMEHVSVVKLKPGAEIEVGYARGNFEDANGVALSGGGMQVRIMNNYREFAEFQKIQ